MPKEKNGNETKKDLKFLYKILNQRIGEEVKEGYTVSNIFLLVNGGMVAIIGVSIGGKSMSFLLIFLISMLGVIISSLWCRSVEAHYKWKNLLWIRQIKEVEKKLFKNDQQNQVWNNIIGNAENIIKPGSISKNIKWLSIAFIIFWGILSLVFFYLSVPFIISLICR